MLESIASAKNNLPKLVHQVQDSEPIVLTRRGKPVAVLQSYAHFQAQQLQANSSDNWFTRTLKLSAENADIIAAANLTDAQIDSWRSRETPTITPPAE